MYDMKMMSTNGNEFGYWGHATSTVDWCEPNYLYTIYIAEFFNTLSSFAMVICGTMGVWFHYKFLEKRFIFAFISVAIVGIGSAAFHGTLLFTLQMLDELPMIYSALIMSYAVFEHHNPRPKYKFLPLILVIHALITSLLVSSPAFFPKYSNAVLQFFSFHVSFAILELFLLYQSARMYRLEKNKKLKKMHLWGALLWICGIACWVADYTGCSLIWEGEHGLRRRYLTWDVDLFGERYSINIPNPQLHAWWHIFASAGLYFMAITVAQNRCQVLGMTTDIEWYLGFLPFIRLHSLNGNKRETSNSNLIKTGESKEKDQFQIYDKLEGQQRKRKSHVKGR